MFSRLAILPLIAVLWAMPAGAEPLPQTAEYLRKIGIDPQSERVKAVFADAIRMRNGEIASLDELAKQKKPKAVILRFVSTRSFVHAYLRDQSTRLTATDDYDAAYVSPVEKAYVQYAFRKAGDELYLQSLQQGRK